MCHVSDHRLPLNIQLLVFKIQDKLLSRTETLCRGCNQVFSRIIHLGKLLWLISLKECKKIRSGSISCKECNFPTFFFLLSNWHRLLVCQMHVMVPIAKTDRHPFVPKKIQDQRLQSCSLPLTLFFSLAPQQCRITDAIYRFFTFLNIFTLLQRQSQLKSD